VISHQHFFKRILAEGSDSVKYFNNTDLILE